MQVGATSGGRATSAASASSATGASNALLLFWKRIGKNKKQLNSRIIKKFFLIVFIKKLVFSGHKEINGFLGRRGGMVRQGTGS